MSVVPITSAPTSCPPFTSKCWTPDKQRMKEAIVLRLAECHDLFGSPQWSVERRNRHFTKIMSTINSGQPIMTRWVDVNKSNNKRMT